MSLLEIKPLLPDGIEERLAAYLEDSGERRYGVAADGTDLPENHPDCVLLWQAAAWFELSEDPKNGFHYLHLADSYLAAHDFENAIRVYDELEKLGDIFLGYYDCPSFHRGWAEADRGNHELALAAFERARDQYPDARHELSWYVGTVFHQMGNHDRAIQCYEECISHIGLKETVREQLSRARKELPFDGRRKWPIM